MEGSKRVFNPLQYNDEKFVTEGIENRNSPEISSNTGVRNEVQRSAAQVIPTTSLNMDSCDWQMTKHNSIQRRKHILETGKLADCKFIIGQKPHQQILKGHKMILAIASPVFEAMFFGEMAEKNDSIPIEDVQPETFKALLEYIYTDIVNPRSCELASELCYCAKKYMLPFLDEECTKFILSNLSPENACQAHELAELLEKPLLMKRCEKIFSTMTSSILSNPSFEEIQLRTLVKIFEQEKLQINSEIELFSAVERWATSECVRKRLDRKNRNSLRSVIGNALGKIRFLTLTPQQFADGTAGSTLLRENEALAIFMNISSKNKNLPMPGGFSTNTQSRGNPQNQIPRRVKESFAKMERSRAHQIEQFHPARFGTTLVDAGSYTGRKNYCRRVENNRSPEFCTGYYSSQPVSEKIHLGGPNAMKSSVAFTVDRNISIIGIQVPAQVRNSEKSGNRAHNTPYTNRGVYHSTPAQNVSDKYDEMLTVTLCNFNETILASTNYAAQVEKHTLIEVMFNRLINIEKDEVYHINVIFKRNGIYPRLPGNHTVSCNSMSFSFGVGNTTDVVQSIIFSDDLSND